MSNRQQENRAVVEKIRARRNARMSGASAGSPPASHPPTRSAVSGESPAPAVTDLGPPPESLMQAAWTVCDAIRRTKPVLFYGSILSLIVLAVQGVAAAAGLFL